MIGNGRRTAEVYLFLAIVLIYAAQGQIAEQRRRERGRSHERVRAYRDLELDNIRLATELDEANKRPRFLAGRNGEVLDAEAAAELELGVDHE